MRPSCNTRPLEAGTSRIRQPRALARLRRKAASGACAAPPSATPRPRPARCRERPQPQPVSGRRRSSACLVGQAPDGVHGREQRCGLVGRLHEVARGVRAPESATKTAWHSHTETRTGARTPPGRPSGFRKETPPSRSPPCEARSSRAPHALRLERANQDSTPWSTADMGRTCRGSISRTRRCAGHRARFPARRPGERRQRSMISSERPVRAYHA